MSLNVAWQSFAFTETPSVSQPTLDTQVPSHLYEHSSRTKDFRGVKSEENSRLSKIFANRLVYHESRVLSLYVYSRLTYSND